MNEIDGDKKLAELEQKYEMTTEEFKRRYYSNPTKLERKIESDDFYLWILLGV